MGKKINSNGGFKEGYAVNRIRTNPTKDETPVDLEKISYPDGIIPFCVILFLYVAGLIASLVSAYFLDPFFATTWPNYVVSVAAVTLCMNLLWLIGRTGIFASFGYAAISFSRITHFDKVREKVRSTPIAMGLEEVKDFKTFKDYVTIRQKYTKKWTYISLGTHLGIFIVSLIIMIIVNTMN